MYANVLYGLYSSCRPFLLKFTTNSATIVSLIFQLKALSHYTNEQIEVAVSFASKPEIVTNIRQRNIEVRILNYPNLCVEIQPWFYHKNKTMVLLVFG